MRKGSFAGVLAVAAAASIWGTLGFFAKILYAEGVSFEALVATRACGGFAVMLGFMALTGRVGRLRVGSRDLAFLVPLGAISIGAFYLLFFYTVQEIAIGTATILLYSSPAFVVILARIFLREALNPERLAALLLTAAGIFLVVGAYDLGALEVRSLFILTGLGAGLTYGLYSVVGKPLTGRLPAEVIITYILGVGAVVLTLAALPTLHTLGGLSVRTYALLATTAVVHTTGAYAFYTFGLRRLEAGQAAIIATMEVVVAMIVGRVLLAEDLTAPKVFGALLVLAGAALAQRGTGGKEPGPPPQ